MTNPSTRRSVFRRNDLRDAITSFDCRPNRDWRTNGWSSEGTRYSDRSGPCGTARSGDDAWVIELAGRSIGGMCSTILEFGAGASLEELILLNAVGRFNGANAMTSAVGVMMIPIPASGVLRCVNGLEEARGVPGVTGIQLTASIGLPIQALPEGASYLGFIFAKGDDPAQVEQTLRDAHEHLEIRIDRLLSLRRID